MKFLLISLACITLLGCAEGATHFDPRIGQMVDDNGKPHCLMLQCLLVPIGLSSF
jgi:hypothetical protein